MEISEAFWILNGATTLYFVVSRLMEAEKVRASAFFLSLSLFLFIRRLSVSIAAVVCSYGDINAKRFVYTGVARGKDLKVCEMHVMQERRFEICICALLLRDGLIRY